MLTYDRVDLRHESPAGHDLPWPPRGEGMQRLIKLLAVVLVLASCSGDDGPTVTEAADEEPAETSTTTTAPPDAPADDTVAYFEAFVGNDINTMPYMLEHSREGSPAYVYAQIDLATLFTEPAGEKQIDVGEDTITLTGDDGEGGKFETTFGDFEASPEGLLVRFSVDGQAIADRIADPGPSGSASGVTATLRSAYQSVTANALNIVLDVSNGTAGPFTDASYDSSYIDADDRQYAVDQQGAPPVTVQPGATAIVFLSFPRAPVGGRVVYKGYLNEFLDEVSIEVPVR